MNLRQKAKHYKQLYEMTGAKYVHPNVTYETGYIKDFCSAGQIRTYDFENYQDLYNHQGYIEKDVRYTAVERLQEYVDVTWEDQGDGILICLGRISIVDRGGKHGNT